MEDNRLLKFGIVGGGKGGLFTYDLIKETKYGKLQFVIDPDNEAPLMKIATKKNLITLNDFNEVDFNEIDFVFEVTGIPSVLEQLTKKCRGTKVKIIDNSIIHLFNKIIPEYFNIDTEEEDDDSALQNKYLTFELDSEIYAFPLWQVLEIITMQEITPLPDSPSYIKGVIKLRDHIIPCLCLKNFFHLDEREYDENTCIIIIENEGKRVGIIIDKVREVTGILPENVEKGLSDVTASASKKHVIDGVGRLTNDTVAVILNIEKLLHGENLGTLEKEAVSESDASAS